MGSQGTTTIERILDQQGRNMTWLADQTEVSQSYAWRMIRGERPITDDFKKAAAKALGVPVDIVFPEPAPAEGVA